MKKTLFVFALAAVLVLSFSTVAMAKYAGYAYNTAGGGHVGYLSWAGAQALMAANGTTETTATPHGGYAANTTKCAVCHSVHRAASDATVAGVASYWKLTPGAQACIACHTAWGSNPIPTALVEWGNPVAGGGGPHEHANPLNACLGSCHAGVHGGATSEYGAVMAYNLTNANDLAIAAAFAAGNVSDNGANKGGSNPTGTYAVIDDASYRAYSWATYDSASTQDRAVMRAMTTGYTCGAAGCHSSSQFAVNKHGYAELRASNPGASTTLDQYMTAHITNMPSGCSPCHVTDDNKCAACHDMRGQATNSSAFPHGNRNIVVYEKADGGTWQLPNASVTTTIVAEGNLWMYSGDATYRDGSGVPTTTAMYSGYSARTVIRDAAGFHGGQAGDIRDGVCIKCHGYKYWPTHGLQLGGSHGGSAALNFATK